jgi:hypothetical protein
MKKVRIVTMLFGVIAVALSGDLGARAQTPSLNEDIAKLIQSHLPESVVINKIREGAGRWDTSVDALIALKNAGATEGELAALTAPPAASAAPSSAQERDTIRRVSLFNGTLTAGDGEVTLFVPGSNATDRSNMLFHLVVANGRPALKLAVRADIIGLTMWQCFTTYGDLIFEHDQATYYPYAKGKMDDTVGQVEDHPGKVDTSLKPEVYPMADIHPQNTHTKAMPAW